MGKPLTLRAALNLPVGGRTLGWIQMFASYPNVLLGVPWHPGVLAHQLAASQRLYGAVARQGQQLTMTWTPTRPGSYKISVARRFGDGGSGAGGIGTIRVRAA